MIRRGSTGAEHPTRNNCWSTLAKREVHLASEEVARSKPSIVVALVWAWLPQARVNRRRLALFGAAGATTDSTPLGSTAEGRLTTKNTLNYARILAGAGEGSVGRAEPA